MVNIWLMMVNGLLNTFGGFQLVMTGYPQSSSQIGILHDKPMAKNEVPPMAMETLE